MRKMKNSVIKISFILVLFLTMTIGAIGNPVAVKADFQFAFDTQLTANNAATNDNLGSSVSISGDTAVLGAPFKGSYMGAAYVYVHDGSAWSQQAELIAGDGKAGDLFGWSVSIDGDIVAIGAQGKNGYRGRVYVFERSGSTWRQTAELDGNENMRYGERLARKGSGCLLRNRWLLNPARCLFI
jgi:hypothetical protein